MKKIIFFVVILVLATTLVVKSQDSTRINIYVGLVGNGFMQTDSMFLKKEANFRIGVQYTEKIFGKITYDGRIGIDPGKENNVIFYSSLKAKWKNLGISVGYQPTPVSEMRPTPLSVDGQFQFTAEAIPPGGALGATVLFHNVKAGFYLRNKKKEYQLTYSNKIFAIGAWTNTVDSIKTLLGGVTAKIKLPCLYVMASITADKRKALALSIRPIKKIDYNLVWDVARDDKKVCNNLLGIMHFLKSKKLTDARYGIGYDFVTRSTGAFFLIGFNHKE